MPATTLVRVASLLSCACLLFPEASGAQSAPEPHLVCWRGAPKPSCRFTILTNFGLYAVAGSRETFVLDPLSQLELTQERLGVNARFLGDWGFLYNVGRRDAIGVSLLGAKSTAGFGNGAELAVFARYRRWLSGQRSLDLALGIPVILRNADALRAPYGLVKFNFDQRLGVALRPELHRDYEFSNAMPARKRTRLFLSAGVEVGHKPGFVMSSIGAALLGILTFIVVHYGD